MTSNQQQNEVSVPPSPSSSTASVYSMWDAFEHVLLFISLYTVAISIALMLHLFVDKWSPDIFRSGYGFSPSFASFQPYLLRGYMAALIVSYPIFSFLFLKIAGRTKNLPSLRNLRARKIFIYLTLIGTFIISMISIIQIVLNFLNGNITVNFLLHFFVTFGISGLIFMYYVSQVKGDRQIHA